MYFFPTSSSSIFFVVIPVFILFFPSTIYCTLPLILFSKRHCFCLFSSPFSPQFYDAPFYCLESKAARGKREKKKIMVRREGEKGKRVGGDRDGLARTQMPSFLVFLNGSDSPVCSVSLFAELQAWQKASLKNASE